MAPLALFLLLDGILIALAWQNLLFGLAGLTDLQTPLHATAFDYVGVAFDFVYALALALLIWQRIRKPLSTSLILLITAAVLLAGLALLVVSYLRFIVFAPVWD